MSDDQQAPGLISGHAQFAKGYINETVGAVTGSEAWSTSGAQTKQAGIQEMKAAGEKRDQDNTQHGLGSVEKMAGQAVGCEGMEKEGSNTSM